MYMQHLHICNMHYICKYMYIYKTQVSGIWSCKSNCLINRDGKIVLILRQRMDAVKAFGDTTLNTLFILPSVKNMMR